MANGKAGRPTKYKQQLPKARDYDGKTEKELKKLLTLGLTRDEIAIKLGISLPQVNYYARKNAEELRGLISKAAEENAVEILNITKIILKDPLFSLDSEEDKKVITNAISYYRDVSPTKRATNTMKLALRVAESIGLISSQYKNLNISQTNNYNDNLDDKQQILKQMFGKMLEHNPAIDTKNIIDVEPDEEQDD